MFWRYNTKVLYQSMMGYVLTMMDFFTNNGEFCSPNIGHAFSGGAGPEQGRGAMVETLQWLANHGLDGTVSTQAPPTTA